MKYCKQLIIEKLNGITTSRTRTHDLGYTTIPVSVIC